MKKILNEFQLATSGAPKSNVEVLTLSSGEPRFALGIGYLAASETGKPGYRLFWQIPVSDGTSIEVSETVRDAPEITESGATATLREYAADIVCEDLLGSGNETKVHYREFDKALGATGVRVEPFEAGDEANPGVITIYAGGPS